MRKFVILAGTALLGACGGGSGGGAVFSAPVTPSTSGSQATNTVHSFVNPTEPKTYSGIGAHHVFDYRTDDRLCCQQQSQTYAGNASTARSTTISVGYDPRSALYTLNVKDTSTGAATDVTFQDPANRTNFGGAIEPQWGTPNLNNANIGYLQAGDGNLRSPYSHSGNGVVDPGTNADPASGEPGSGYQSTSMFVLKPGSETKYVTWAGYARNAFTWSRQTIAGTAVNVHHWHAERGAFAFGERTDNAGVPKTGTGSYNGSLMASMIFNPTLDGTDQSGPDILPSYFQWMTGTSKVDVNFAASTFTMALTGTVMAPQLDYFTSPTTSVLQAGATFAAAGRGDINLVNFGGFKGQFQTASFQNPGGGSAYNLVIAGSSIDGAFYGPNGEEVGGGFRIVGGKPDERIDVLGAFVGKK